MAYGQTGSGKSFSMQEDPDNIGIIPRAIVHIFEGKERDEDRDTVYTVNLKIFLFCQSKDTSTFTKNYVEVI
jgi:hypothetical protein